MLLIAMAGCGDSGPVWLPFPPLNQAQTLMVGVDGADGTQLHVVDLAAAPASLSFPLGEQPFTARALLYTERVEAMGMTAGVMTSLDTPAEALEPLPQPRDIFAVEVPVGSTEARWRITDDLGASLSSFRHDPAPLCFELDAETVALQTVAGSKYAVAIDGNTALIGVRTGEAFLVDADRTVTKLTGRPPTYFTAAVRADDGLLWLGDSLGRVYRGTVGPGFAVDFVSRAPVTKEIWFMAVGEAADGEVELFIIDELGTFLRFHRGQWERLHRFTDTGDNRKMGGVVRLGPSRAIAAWLADGHVVWYEGGAARREVVHQFDGLTAINVLDDGAILVGTAGGELVRWQPDTSWRALPYPKLNRWVQQIAPYPGGFIFGTAFGALIPYLFGAASCEPAANHPDNVDSMVVLDDGTVIASGANPQAAGGTPVTIARPR